jgi:hypothetical protein
MALARESGAQRGLFDKKKIPKIINIVTLSLSLNG